MATMMSTVCGAGGDRAPIFLATGFTERAPLSNGVIGRNFTAAVLLTGSVRKAEAAMLEAIHGMDAEEASDQTFLLDCVKASLVPGRQSQAQAKDAQSAACILPAELRPILSLARDLRHAFVLRMFLRLSREGCARLNIRDVDQLVCAAAQQLARVS